MPKSGAATREGILDAAEELILSHGYAGTSVEAILSRTGMTKGAFFHHFPSKLALARELVERYAARDRQQLEEHLERSERLSREPVHQVLILVGLYEEMLDQLTEPYPGCLFASYCYQAGLFDEEIHGVIRESMLHWRDVLSRKLRAALERHETPVPVNADELADGALVILEGSFILSRTLNEPKLVARQLRQFRNYLELLFGVTGPVGQVSGADT